MLLYRIVLIRVLGRFMQFCTLSAVEPCNYLFKKQFKHSALSGSSTVQKFGFIALQIPAYDENLENNFFDGY